MRVAKFLLIPLIVAAASAAQSVEIGKPAPSLGSTATVTPDNPKGPAVSLSALKGKVVLIDFWATWCGPCVAAIPHVQELHNKYGDKGLIVIGHTDGSSKNLQQFIKDKKITYQISLGNTIGDQWGVTGIPHVFIVDVAGNVAWEGHPAELKDEVIETQLKRVKPMGEANK
jgi:thiol-disulfide isomerase/thioredoxin